jgi:hypothetical protein
LARHPAWIQEYQPNVSPNAQRLIAEMRHIESVMQLRAARLCLDCEEVHDAQQCPVCASESFAAMTRWVPMADRRGRSRPIITPEAAAYQALVGDETPASRTRQLLKHGALGLTAVGVIGWVLRGSKPVPKLPQNKSN